MIRHERTACVLALLLSAVALPALAAQSPSGHDGQGEIESMEQQSMLIDGQGYNVAGATIKAIGESDTGETRVRIVGRIDGSTPVIEVLPHGVESVAYDLVPGSQRRIQTLWIDDPGVVNDAAE